MLLLLLMLMLLMRFVAPLPFDGSLTHHKPSVCILAVRTGTYTDSPLHSCYHCTSASVAYATTSMSLTHC